MDKTPIYAKMCEAAEEVQAAWEPTISDYIAYKRDHNIIQWCNAEDPDSPSWKTNWIFLARQDQLQSMVFPELDDYGKLVHFFSFCDPTQRTVHGPAISLEQLWLAFVMHERWKKFWNGFEWIADPKFEMFKKKED